jgi:hypothetical protein
MKGLDRWESGPNAVYGGEKTAEFVENCGKLLDADWAFR